MNTIQTVSRSENISQDSLVDLKAGMQAITRTINPLSIHRFDAKQDLETDTTFNIMTEEGIGWEAIAYPGSPRPRRLTGRPQLIEPDVKKIAVLRSNGIGDFIFSLPALESLRRAYPQAEIVLLALDWHAAFLQNRPGPVDRVIVVPKSRSVNGPEGGEEDPQELDRFFSKMVQEEFDIAIQMHGGGRYSNPFTRRLGARLTVGACSEDALPLDRCIPYHLYQMEILRYIEIASLVGAYPTYLEPRVFVTDEDLRASIQELPEAPEPLIVINPGAGDPRRRWPVEKFAQVGDALASVGARVAVVGAEWDREIVQGMREAMSAPSHDLCGKLDLNSLAGLFSRASLVVSNDSGPLHLAAAVGAPTVGIYWCANMITAGPVNRSNHLPVIAWRLDCPLCGADCVHSKCGHQDSLVADISVDEVIRAAFSLLKTTEIRPAYPHIKILP
jgi:ADP-heptose:LPS heptosyltransferase